MLPMEAHSWISGKSVAISDSEPLIRYSPADGRELCRIIPGDASTVDQAVAAAGAAFPLWAQKSGSERSTLLMRMADILQDRLNKLAELESEEAGKALEHAKDEIGYAIELVLYAASLARNLSGKIMTDDGPDKFGMVLRQPRGVIGLILPWNYPMVCLMQKLPFALAAGCTVVIKPSELTPSTTIEVAKAAQEAGVPDGVINIVLGTGPVVGEAISAHKDVAMVSFTGSTAIGQKIAMNAASKLSPVALELGGKGANIIFADADIDAAVDGAVAGYTINKGEECCAGGRIFVEESIADDFIEKLAAKSKALKVGLPSDSSTEMGPLISTQQLDKVLNYIEVGKREGAKLICGGSRLTDGDLAKGCFVAPTLFTDARPDMKIVREEIFGPVAVVFRFKTKEEAIELANDTTYGLANGVWTSNLDTALAVVRGLESGTVYVNTFLETIPQLPFGGMKHSGVGRENGIEGLEEFLETKGAFFKLKP